MNRKTFAVTATALMLSAGMLLSGIASAEMDFSEYTNQEMAQIYNRVDNMSDSDRALVQAEMQKRLRSMTPAERQKLGLNGQASKLRERISEDNDQGKGDLNRDRKRLEDGTGIGQAEQDKLRERINADNAQGKGDMSRERMRLEDGSGIDQGKLDQLRKRLNEDSNQGRGELERSRMRNEMEGYGRGFGTRSSGGMGGGGGRGR